jgi:hypothetical protein
MAFGKEAGDCRRLVLGLKAEASADGLGGPGLGSEVPGELGGSGRGCVLCGRTGGR